MGIVGSGPTLDAVAAIVIVGAILVLIITVYISQTDQVYISVSSTIGYGTSPESGMYYLNSNINLTANSYYDYTFENWTCTGKGCYSGDMPNVTLRLNNSITEVAHYKYNSSYYATTTIYYPNYSTTINYTPTTTIANLPTAHVMAYNPKDGYFYAATYYADTPHYGTSLIAMNANLVKTLAEGNVSINAYLDYIMYDPLDGNVYEADADTSQVLRISGFNITGAVSVAQTPDYLVLDPKNGYIYALGANSSSRSGSAQVTVLNGLTPIANITIPVRANAGIYDPKDNLVYVIEGWGSELSIINGTRLVENITLPGTPEGIAYNPTNGYVYIETYLTTPKIVNAVIILNGTNTIKTLYVGKQPGTQTSEPYGIIYDPANHYVYVTSGGGFGGFGVDQVSVINGTRIIENVSIDQPPADIAYDPVNKDVFVESGLNYWSITVIQNNSNEIKGFSQAPYTGSIPNFMAVDNSTGYVYVSNINSTVTIMNVTLPVETFTLGST